MYGGLSTLGVTSLETWWILNSLFLYFICFLIQAATSFSIGWSGPIRFLQRLPGPSWFGPVRRLRWPTIVFPSKRIALMSWILLCFLGFARLFGDDGPYEISMALSSAPNATMAANDTKPGSSVATQLALLDSGSDFSLALRATTAARDGVQLESGKHAAASDVAKASHTDAVSPIAPSLSRGWNSAAVLQPRERFSLGISAARDGQLESGEHGAAASVAKASHNEAGDVSPIAPSPSRAWNSFATLQPGGVYLGKGVAPS